MRILPYNIHCTAIRYKYYAQKNVKRCVRPPTLYYYYIYNPKVLRIVYTSRYPRNSHN